MKKNRLDQTAQLVLQKVRRLDNKWTKTITIMGVTVIVFAFLYSVFMRHDTVIQPYFFISNDNTLKYVTSDSATPQTITKVNEVGRISYSHKSNKKVVYTIGEATFVLDTAKGKSTPLRNDITFHSFNENDKYLIYLTKDHNLYYYDFSSTQQLDSGVTTVLYLTEDQIIYQKDHTLYIRSYQKDDKRLIADYVEEVTYHKKSNQLLYKIKNEDLYNYYIYSLKNRETRLVLENISSLYSYDDKLQTFVYSVPNKTSFFHMTDLLEDPYEQEDATLQQYTVDDVLKGTITYEEYLTNQKQIETIQKRNQIRTTVEEYLDMLPSNTIYIKNQEGITKVTDRAKHLIFADANTSLVIYSEYLLEQKIHIDQIENLYALSEILSIDKEKVIYTKKGIHAKELLIKDQKEELSFYLTGNNDLYYVINQSLYYLPYKMDEVLDAVLIDENIIIDPKYKEFNNHLLYTADQKLKKVITNQKETIDEQVSSILHIDEKKQVVLYLTNYDHATKRGILKRFQKEVKTLSDNVYDATYVTNHLIYILKDYSSVTDTFDLYRFIGGSTLEKIENGVKKVIAN